MNTLTDRDRALLRYIAQGLTLKQVAPLFGLSYRGAAKAASRAMHRVPGAKSSQHAAILAEERGWLTTQEKQS